MLTVQDIHKRILKKMSKKKYNTTLKNLKQITPFSVDGNYPLTDEERSVMTNEVKFHLNKIFEILKFDETDPNIIDTPSRVASMWVNEMMVGRYMEKPRLEAFPVEEKQLKANLEGVIEYNGMLIKKIDILSLCSHHLMPFYTDGENSYALVAYKPRDKYLGISKIQRLAFWLGARPQLQEQLTFNLYKEMADTLGSQDIFVILKNLTHTCETLRGAKTECGSTTSLFYGGIFNDATLRKEVVDAVK